MDKELIKKQYKEWVEQVSEDLPDKTFFSIDEVVTKVIDLVEQAKKNEVLDLVSHQRKLLEFFANDWNENQTTSETCIEYLDIEGCIKKYNCG